MAFKWDEQKLDRGEKDDCVTYSRQHELPKLPVLELQPSIHKLVQWAQPLCDPATFSETQRVAKDFLKPNGPGQALQTALEKWGAQDSLDSWLEPFWDEGYLRARCPTVMNVNFGMCFNVDVNVDWITKAAGLVHGVLRFHQSLQKQEYRVDTERGTPLCMLQYQRLFGLNRIPNRESDTWLMPPLRNPTRHIVVFLHGTAFAVDVVDADGSPASVAQVRKVLAMLQQQERKVTASSTKGQGLGVFTGLDRDKWADLRVQILRASTDNAKALNLIETALFALSLDDLEVKSKVEHAKLAHFGNPKNRWYDKSFTLIVARDGSCALNGEHSWGDATTVGAMLEEALNWLHTTSTRALLSKAANVTPSTASVGMLRLEVLRFMLPPNLVAELEQSARLVESTVESQLLAVVTAEYGAELAKKARLSPDGVAQAIFHATQYKAWGRCSSAYESAMTKTFLHGRTEAMRPVTSEMVEFAKLLTTSTTDKDRDLISSALQKAVETHVARMKECKAGKGVDRHLFGLREMYARYGKALGLKETPALFSDKGVGALTHDTLSTSQITTRHITQVTFGPVVKDGLGIPYSIQPGKMVIVVTAEQENEVRWKQFTKALPKVVDTMRKILMHRASRPAGAANPPSKL